MDCHSITLFFRTMSGYLSLLFLLMLSVPLQGASITASAAKACGSAPGNYQVTFTITDFDPLEPDDDFYALSIVRRRAIFIYFGDGTHVELIAYEDEEEVSCDHIYTNINNTETPFEIIAQVTSVYIPSNQDTERVISQTKSQTLSYNLVANLNSTTETPPCNSCETDPEEENHLPGRFSFPINPSPDEKGWVQRIRHAVPSDKFVLAVQYGFDICSLNSGQSFDSLITIAYDSDIFQYKGSNLNLNAQEGFLTYGFEVGSNIDIRDEMMYLFFDVKGAEVAGNEYEFEIRRRYTADDACDGKATFNDVFVNITETVRSSHDPNAKLVDPLYFTSAGPVLLHYTIRFFNNGSSPVEWIMIKDSLDKRLDFTTVDNVIFSTHGVSASTPINLSAQSSDNVFKWLIKPEMLPAGGLKPTEGDQALPNEYAYLRFTVETKSGLPPNTCIPNEAIIFFYESDTTGASRTVVDQVLSCRNVCEQVVAVNEKFRLSSEEGKIIRINEAPNYLITTDGEHFYFDSESFSKAKVVFQECKKLESGELACGPIQTRTFCKPPSRSFPWGLILLLLVSAVLIYLTARRSPNI